MTPERFIALADAYGGDIDRWPVSERAEAQAHLLAQPGARDILAAQSELDDALASWMVPGPGAALSAAIVSAAARRGSYGRRIRLWLSGLGGGAVLAGGIAAGASFIALTSPPRDQPTAHLYELSVLGAPLDLGTDTTVDRNF